MYNRHALIDSIKDVWYDTASHTYTDTVYDKEAVYYEDATDILHPHDAGNAPIIFPNPTGGTIIINWDGPLTGTAVFKVFDMLGQAVMADKWTGKSRAIDCLRWPANAYVMSFTNADSAPVHREKIIKY